MAGKKGGKLVKERRRGRLVNRKEGCRKGEWKEGEARRPCNRRKRGRREKRRNEGGEEGTGTGE